MSKIIETIKLTRINLIIHQIQTSNAKIWYFEHGDCLSYLDALYFDRPKDVKKGGRRRPIPEINLKEWEEYKRIRDAM